MIEFAELPLSALILDLRNARLKDPQANQPAALLALARQEGKKLLELARSIVDQGRLDPLSPMGVVPSPDNPLEYIVVEGNRRLVALKGLETPAVIAAAFNARDQRILQKLAERYRGNPIHTVRCAVFDTEPESTEWIKLRHDGQSGGAGLVQWGSDEKDRFRARHEAQPRSPAGQIIDFVESRGLLSDAAKNSRRGILSNLERMLSSRALCDVLGVSVAPGGKALLMHYPAEEVAKSLTRVVEDLKTGVTKVGDIYYAPDREAFAHRFPESDRPRSSTRLVGPVPLGADTASAMPAKPKTKGGKREKPPTPPVPRSTVIPPNCRLNIPALRTNLIYHELLRLQLSEVINSCAVMLRVFLELSADDYVEREKLLSDPQMKNTPLSKKLHLVAADLRSKGKISLLLQEAIDDVADRSKVLATSAVTFNAYVHNPYKHPQADDLRSAWDELQPFVEAIWP